MTLTVLRHYREVLRYLAFLPFSLFACHLGAEGLESVLMPGKVIEAHAEFEMECSKCHVVFDREAQPKLCGDCHEEVVADIEAKKGFHGRLDDTECLNCHFEHKGRDAQLAPLDPKTFDHTLTDFLLRGEHGKTECASCHKEAHKFSEAPVECGVCHKDDDVHKKALGEVCADCHEDLSWTGAPFDHLAVTDYALRFKHADVGCTDCHQDHHYEETPTDCKQCHIEDDTHEGQFGSQCQQCHQESDWTEIQFDHDRDTDFPLLGLHAPASCESCHMKHLFDTKTSTECSACHKKGDPHGGALGNRCETCHSADGWLETQFLHNRDSRFRLDGRHRKVECNQCHSDSTFKTMPSRSCVACHEKDEQTSGHQDQFGQSCDTCHNVKSWSAIIFDHGDTTFPLLGEHLSTPCESCHQNDQFAQTATACVACHLEDDIHQERLGPECGQCHVPQAWSDTRFNHDQDTDFPLAGAHQNIKCVACHLDPMPGKIMLPSQCKDCHADEDVHFGSLSDQCGRCHLPTDGREMKPNAREWMKLGGPPADTPQ